MGAASIVAKRTAACLVLCMLFFATYWNLPAAIRKTAGNWAATTTAGRDDSSEGGRMQQSSQQPPANWAATTAAGRDEEGARMQQDLQAALKYAVISSASSPLYSFFVPITALIWKRRQQFEPPIFLVNDIPTTAAANDIKTGSSHGNWSSSRHTAVVLKYLARWGLGSNHIGLEYDATAGANNNALLSQLSRLYAAGLCCQDLLGPLQGLSNPDSWLVTTDVDIWPIAPAAYFLPDNNGSGSAVGKITNAFCCSAGYTVLDLVIGREYPMTTAAYQVKTWRDLMNYTCICNSSSNNCSTALMRHMNMELQHVFNMRPGVGTPKQQWYFDQRLLSYNIHAHRYIHNKTQLVPRRTAADRIDRIAWRHQAWNEELLQTFVEAHVLRPGYADKHWLALQELLQPLLKLNGSSSDSQLWQELQDYKAEFVDAVSGVAVPAL